MKTVKGRVYGRVQGVFFRKFTKNKAKELNINGFVKNEFDGSVYFEAEGDQNKIDEFINWCKKGSPGSNVTNIEIEYTEPKNYIDFQIKY